jgi:hypothetical protein
MISAAGFFRDSSEDLKLLPLFLEKFSLSVDFGLTFPQSFSCSLLLGQELGL